MSKVSAIVKRVKELGMDSVAITDHGVLYGAIEFYKRCKSAGIKPIIGSEVYVVDGDRNEKKGRDNIYHLILLATNLTGYQNLVKIVSDAQTNGFYYKPRTDRATIAQYHEGLIALSSCLGSELGQALLAKDDKRAEQIASEYKKIFGHDYYIEIQSHPKMPEQIEVNRRLVALAQRLSIEIVVGQDAHYVDKADAEAHNVLLAVQTGAQITDEKRFRMDQDDFSITSGDEIYGRLKDELGEAVAKQAVENTCKIADLCNLELELGKLQLPPFEIPEGQKDAFSYLSMLAWGGLLMRYEKIGMPAGAYERMQYELSIVQKTGFATYFLIVQDFVRWAKENGIAVGPGRGSAAGSLLSYSLGITNIDPLKYNLIFERFLNPERIAPPDIDLDFSDRRREEVIKYVEDTYGHDHVAQIITFGTMAARAAIRDVSRAMGVDYAKADRLAKLVPFNPNQDADLKVQAMFLRHCVENEPEVMAVYKSDAEAKRVFDIAMQLEGVARHHGVHACAVVITPKPLTEHLPIQHASDGETVVTQFDLHAVEDLGLLKMDFLGLKNLTIIEDTVKMVKERHGVTLDIDNLPLDDAKTFNLLRAGKTTGIFQLESPGMKKNLKSLKPTEIEDIIAMVSLYRPGPMELIPDYVARKHKRKAVEYLYPTLEPVLKNTHGVMIYQEQLIQAVQVLAGFTLSEADVLRKAVGKKDKALLDKQEGKFKAGCERVGTPKDIADKFWALVEPFNRYAFNRCLSGDTIVYRTATNEHTTRGITLEKLYEVWNSKTDAGKKYRRQGLTILSYKDGRIKRGKAIAIHQNGIKDTYEILLENGMSITSTTNHRHMTPYGWVRTDRLNIGTPLVVTNGEYEPTYKPSGLGHGWAKHESMRKKASDGRMRPSKGGHTADLKFVKTKLPGICEAEGCGKKIDIRFEAAHLDHDRTNNSRDNVKNLCNSCHKKWDYATGRRVKRMDKGYPTYQSNITKIRYAGKRMTYDLEMEDTEHNFVANGIVTHNSHAACYAMIAYQTAYLKANYPLEFMTAYLNSESSSIEKLGIVIEEARAMGISIMPPDVNESQQTFAIAGKNIRFGLAAIKNVGSKSVEKIIEVRNKDGRYTSVRNFMTRVKERTTTKKTLDSLAKCGALDTLSERALVIGNLEAMIAYVKELKDEHIFPEMQLAAMKPATKKEMAVWEKELLGLYVTSHPMAEYRQQMLEDGILAICDVELVQDSNAVIGGLITDIRRIITKNGKQMAFITVEDMTGKMRVVIFPMTYNMVKKKISEGAVVIIRGKVDAKQDVPTLLCDNLKTLTRQ